MLKTFKTPYRTQRTIKPTSSLPSSSPSSSSFTSDTDFSDPSSSSAALGPSA